MFFRGVWPLAIGKNDARVRALEGAGGIRQLSKDISSFGRDGLARYAAMMHVEIFCVCQSGKTYEDGTIDLIHVYNELVSESFPIAIEGLTMATRMRFDKKEIGKHHLEISMEDEAGRVLGMPAAGDFIAKPSADQNFAWMSAVIGIPGVAFSNPGRMHLRLKLDGRLESTCILSVVQSVSSSRFSSE